VKKQGTETLFHVNHIRNTPAFPRPPLPLTYNMIKEKVPPEDLILKWLEAYIRFDGDLSSFHRSILGYPNISTSCDSLDLLHTEHRSVLQTVAQNKWVKNPDELKYVYEDLEKFGYLKRNLPILSTRNHPELRWEVANPTLLLLLHTMFINSPITSETLQGYALEYAWKELLARSEVQQKVFPKINFLTFDIVDGYWKDETETEIDFLALATTDQKENVFIVGSSKRNAQEQHFPSSLLRHLVRFFHAENSRLKYLENSVIIPIALNLLGDERQSFWPKSLEEASIEWRKKVNDKASYIDCFGDHKKAFEKEQTKKIYDEKWRKIQSIKPLWGLPVQIFLGDVLSIASREYQRIKSPSILRDLTKFK